MIHDDTGMLTRTKISIQENLDHMHTVFNSYATGGKIRRGAKNSTLFPTAKSTTRLSICASESVCSCLLYTTRVTLHVAGGMKSTTTTTTTNARSIPTGVEDKQTALDRESGWSKFQEVLESNCDTLQFTFTKRTASLRLPSFPFHKPKTNDINSNTPT